MSLQLHLAFVLHKAKQNKEGYAPLVIRFTHQKQRKELASGYQLTTAEWEKVQKGKRLQAEHLKAVVAFMDVCKAKVYQCRYVRP